MTPKSHLGATMRLAVTLTMMQSSASMCEQRTLASAEFLTEPLPSLQADSMLTSSTSAPSPISLFDTRLETPKNSRRRADSSHTWFFVSVLQDCFENKSQVGVCCNGCVTCVSSPSYQADDFGSSAGLRA